MSFPNSRDSDSASNILSNIERSVRRNLTGRSPPRVGREGDPEAMTRARRSKEAIGAFAYREEKSGPRVAATVAFDLSSVIVVVDNV